ncbi:MAG: hypothetical protein KGL39_21345 [Patescibacteria group bacterium]|nr:hypothetical protein [Patescibacteria group bacterium]
MKDISEVVCCVVDYGKFTLLGEAMGEKCKKAYYSTPTNREFQDLNDCAKGDGVGGIERLDDFLDPDRVDEIDLYVFPDVGFAAEQRLLRSLGKAVWGAMGAGRYELYRTQFLDLLKEIGLRAPPSLKIRGLTNLAEHLRKTSKKWIKINRYRAVMETWFHKDFEHSRQKLDALAVRLGGLKDQVPFVVQDEIDSDIEVGYDGWSIDGRFPSSSFQGYELKNELYLGSVLKREQLPTLVRNVNRAMAPVLEEFGYRNFIATEIRGPYFIDPTLRMPGLTGDQLPCTCRNLPEIIWAGANGKLIEPDWGAKFAAVATLHYKDHTSHQWFSVRIPERVRQWVKLYHFCASGDLYHFIPSVPFECDEAGTVVGMGDTIEQAIDQCKANFDELEAEPLTAEIEGFADLLEQIQDAEEKGIEFTDQEVPDPQTVLDEG